MANSSMAAPPAEVNRKAAAHDRAMNAHDTMRLYTLMSALALFSSTMR